MSLHHCLASIAGVPLFARLALSLSLALLVDLLAATRAIGLSTVRIQGWEGHGRVPHGYGRTLTAVL
jgi:hypothetical protein